MTILGKSATKVTNNQVRHKPLIFDHSYLHHKDQFIPICYGNMIRLGIEFGSKASASEASTQKTLKSLFVATIGC